MLKVDVLNLSGKKVGDLELSENVFGVEVNEVAVHSAIVNYLADQRQGTQSTKTRSEVSGGGRKPWKQKGTGRARQGSIRAPQWIKGGIALGPKPRSYTYSIPKKVKVLALKSVLTSKLQEGKLVVVDDLDLGEIKTKKMVEALTKLNSMNSLVVIEKKNVNVQASAKNIEKVKASVVDSINTYDILTHEKLVISKEAIKKIEEVYA